MGRVATADHPAGRGHVCGVPVTALHGKRVLVTGATGFIGGRLAERLVVEEGARVRALVRNFASAARLGRFAIDMVGGDINSAAAVDRAVAGCDTVFHCAYDFSADERSRRETTAASTRVMMESALRHGCRRVVFVSTVSVYGHTPDGDLDERSPRQYSGAAYNDSKLDAEKIALEYGARGLSVSILQPTVVYGPYGGTWTVRPLEHLRHGRMILINGGTGLCNAVYVDDVVSALLLAATNDAAHGETFLVSAAEPVTWREFFAAYETLLGRAATVSMTAEEALRFYRANLPRGVAGETLRVLKREVARREPVVRERLGPNRWGRVALAGADRLRLIPRPEAEDPEPIQPMPPPKIAFSAARTRVRIDKAATVLGYRPAWDLARGMAVTGAWARWANLA
jgi:nucleoside-diphosphate-sugar epimerase